MYFFASEIKSTSTRTKKKNNGAKGGALTRGSVVNIILLSLAISSPHMAHKIATLETNFFSSLSVFVLTEYYRLISDQ
jgi:hypothetical protein